MDLIERIMWPVEKDCGRWKRVVSDMVLGQNGVY